MTFGQSETSYFGVTIHYLEKSSLVSRCLAVTELKERHNSDYIGEVFNNMLQDFNICKENIVTVVTDNGSNMTATVKKILGKNKLTLCFAHTINLVSDVVVSHRGLQPLIKKVRDIVLWVKRSVIISDKLRKLQLEAGVKEGCIKKMILGVKTRWNSTFYMIEQFIEMSSMLSPLVLQYVTAPEIPTAVEMDMLRQTLGLLKLLEFVTRESFGDKYVTVSKIIPMINCLMTQLNELKPTVELIVDVQDKLHAELVKRFGQIELVTQIAIATLLNPRFKNLHFKDPNACAKAMAALRNLIRTDTSSWK